MPGKLRRNTLAIGPLVTVVFVDGGKHGCSFTAPHMLRKGNYVEEVPGLVTVDDEIAFYS